ncbi:uncharacterized protein LOC123540909 [Mercenaria mercenaria]|uniref:uncharacterized protein LOC123540909 n=1 Tax=Mercenaria mercenaria TaxID=6596 RepID=UPI00234F20B3|nr:uncharacterized protein LOC123540909 [Mercenaria mercenaria]
MSERLSEVLDDIGVNCNIAYKRGTAHKLMELMYSGMYSLTGRDVIVNYFGSQIEGTTTLGLRSDRDIVCFPNYYNIIQDLNEWKPGPVNLLMIKDEAPSKGYVYLQYLRDDKPLPLEYPSNPYSIRDLKNRVLLSNTVIESTMCEGHTRNGPAVTHTTPGFRDTDIINGLVCKSWFTYAHPLQTMSREGQWPPKEIQTDAKNTGCFVVPVGCKESENVELEWRVSTSKVERSLVHYLNKTQIMCYILMKMILKEFINIKHYGVITSYICKTGLFHSVQGTHPLVWIESNLLTCLTICLMFLRKFILDRYCPHFIIPCNNLMQGRFSGDVHHGLLELIKDIINGKGEFLFCIETDHLASRLMAKFGMLCRPLKSKIDIWLRISGSMVIEMANCVSNCHRSVLEHIRNENSEVVMRTLFWLNFKLKVSRNVCKDIVRGKWCLFEPLLNTTLGCVIASRSIGQFNTVSLEALGWFSAGLDSDVSSSRLKLASAFYCAGDIQGSENFVIDVQNRYDETSVRNVCSCCQIKNADRFNYSNFDKKAYELNEKAIRVNVSLCVKFLRFEINCIPKELKYEMFRVTKGQFIVSANDVWMELIEVDSLPYLYFLKYKIYGCKGHYEEQQLALSELIRVTNTTPFLGHKETAFNLIGQCLEQENCVYDALRYYIKSLKIRPQVNAANIHICRVISTLISSRKADS